MNLDLPGFTLNAQAHEPKITASHEMNHDEPGFAWICPDGDAHPSAFTL